MIMMTSSVSAVAATIQIGKISRLKMDIPDTWLLNNNAVKEGADGGSSVMLQSTLNKNFLCLMTIVDLPTSRMTKKQLIDSLKDMDRKSIRESVEKKITIVPLDIKNGHGAYYILTEAPVAGKESKEDNFKVKARFQIAYEYDVLITGSVLMGDANCAEFRQFLKSVSAMKPVREKPLKKSGK